MGINRMYAVIGGGHLIEASKERINQTINALKELNSKKIGLCHYTELRAGSLMLDKFLKQFIIITAATLLEF